MWLPCALALIIAAMAHSFDVVSIKPTPPTVRSIAIETTPGRFLAKGATLSFLLQYSYGVQEFEIMDGPSWIQSDRFEIEGKFEGEDTPARMTAMLRDVLTDRFKLKFHRETKQLPVYELIVGKNGPKLSDAGPATKGKEPRFAPADGRLVGSNQTPPIRPSPTPPDPNGPSIFTAIQEQLGLQLKSARGPVEVLVIDYAEKPSIN
jgi:uncharacterized protein DUF3738